MLQLIVRAVCVCVCACVRACMGDWRTASLLQQDLFIIY